MWPLMVGTGGGRGRVVSVPQWEWDACADAAARAALLRRLLS